MNGSVKEKYALDKVVLLGIFALGLLLAYLHIFTRSHVAFTEPLELPYTGITVRMPHGNGWHSDDDWQFTANTFNISSVFSPSAGRITALMEVRYLYAPEEIRPEKQFERYTKELAGTIIETGKIGNSDILIEWVHIEIRDKFLDIFFGIAKLPNGRRLLIEAQAPSSDIGLIEKVFSDTAEAVGFEDNNLLENGRKTVEALRAEGIAKFMANQGRPRFYLIKGEEKQILGFLTELLTVSDREEEPVMIRFSTHYHIRTQQETLSGHSLYQGDQSLRRFLWISKTDSAGAVGGSAVQIELAENGQMMIESYMPLISGNYSISPAAIPEIFIEPFVGLFLKSRTSEAIVDLIFSDGRIIPTRLSVINSEETDTDAQAAYKIGLDFLDRRDYYGQMFLDADKDTFKIILHRKNTYTTQSSNKEEVLKYFPVWRDYFNHMEKQGGIQINLF